MKIVHLANHAEKIGNGIVNVMVDLACLQSKAGHQVAVASSGGSFEPLLERHGVRHLTLPQSPRPWRVPAMLWGFRRVIAETRPDVVHAHMMTGAVLARIGRGRTPYTFVTTIHNEFQRASNLMGLGDRVVAVSEAVARSMAQRGIPEARLCVVRNGIVGAPRFEREGATAPVPALHRPNLVTVSGLYERKGIHDLLHAFRHLKSRVAQAQLYIVGDGPDRAKLEALAQELGVKDSAHFLGYIADPRPYLAQADVFVLPSHSETSSLAIMEAREAGCAIVATNVGGIPETLDQGAAGIMVPVSDRMGLAGAVERLLLDDESRRAWQLRAAQNLDAFSAQRVCNEYMQIYAGAAALYRTPSMKEAARFADGHDVPGR